MYRNSAARVPTALLGAQFALTCSRGRCIMKRLWFSLFLTAGVVALMAPWAAADDDDHRRYRRWHREQLEALEEWQERQEELAEERREWEEERREAAREWQEEQREAAERYERRQRELWEEQQDWRRDSGYYYESHRSVYPQQPYVYRSA